MPYHSSSQHLKEAQHKSVNIKNNLFKCIRWRVLLFGKQGESLETNHEYR
jgi:hypothetical protein